MEQFCIFEIQLQIVFVKCLYIYKNFYVHEKFCILTQTPLRSKLLCSYIRIKFSKSPNTELSRTVFAALL